MIWTLLYPPANLESKNNEGMTALLLAAACGWSSAVELLIKHGANVDHQDKYHRTAMHLALMDKTIMTPHESSVIIKTLLDGDANPNLLATGRGSVLTMAVSRGSLQIVQFLLEHRANPNLQDEEGYTPLHFADDKQIAEVLLEYGANPNLRNTHGSTAVAISGWQDLTCNRTILFSSTPRPK